MRIKVPRYRVVDKKGSVLLGLFVAVLLDTACQLLWKRAAMRLPEAAAVAALTEWFASSPVAWALVGVFALQLINWLFLL